MFVFRLYSSSDVRLIHCERFVSHACKVLLELLLPMVTCMKLTRNNVKW